MTTYIVANRTAGLRASDDRERAKDSVKEALGMFSSLGMSAEPFGARAVGSPDTYESARRTVSMMDMTPEAAREMRRRAPPEIIVEELIEYRKADGVPYDMLRAVPLDWAATFRNSPLNDTSAGAGQTLRVEVLGRRRPFEPIYGAEVHLFLAGPGGIPERLVTRTDRNGKATLEFAHFFEIQGTLVQPYGDFWPKVERGGSSRRHLRILCEALPSGTLGGWWHDSLGIRANSDIGRVRDGVGRMRIGVVDSGCGPHPALTHVVNCGQFLNGDHNRSGQAGYDTGSHGTHVCGTIGARRFGDQPSGLGIAPAAEIFSACVFPPNASANQGDIANAIDHLVQERSVHLINLSLGSPVGSQILHDAIKAAYEDGVLCVCAAGNDAGKVSFPAAFPETLAISAIGRLGEVPLDSLPALPQDARRYGTGQHYLADFSNFGPEINGAAPGVGIVSSVPARFDMAAPFAAMNGTSMASPAACATFAAVLAADERYPSLPSNGDRSRYARAVFADSANRIFAERDYEGHGIPTLAL